MANVRDMGGAPLVRLLALALTLGCGDVTDPPYTGSIRVSLATDGDDIDPNGYGVSVDGTLRGSVGANSSLTIAGVRWGERAVGLEGVAANCAVVSGSERVVTVAAGEQAAATFAVSCAALVGNIVVTTATFGDEPDPDGYVVEIADVVRETRGPFRATEPIGVSGSITLPDVRTGTHVVRLAGVTPNCTVAPPAAPLVTVPFGATTEVSFAIHCVATGGLRVTNVTSGPDPDPDGYTVQIAGAYVGTSAALPTGGAVTTRVAPGHFSVRLGGVAENCAVDFASRQVEVAAGATAAVTFEVVCTPATRLAFVRDGQIHLVNSNGTGLVRLTSEGENTNPAWSPDGRRIAFASERAGGSGIYVMDADGSNVARLTSVTPSNYRPAWSPDGSRIAFVSERDGNLEIYVMGADGTNQVRLTTNAVSDADPAWSPDGGKIAFTRSTPGGLVDVYVMNADGSGITRLTRASASPPSLYARPAWSPDGHRLAVVSTRCDYYCYGASSYEREVVVMNADGSGARSLGPAPAFDTAAPAWSPDGRTLAFPAEACDDGHCRISIVYARVDGSATELIVRDGHSPAWRR